VQVGVDQLAEAQLLKNVVLRTPHVGGLDRAAQHQSHPVKRPPGEVELDLRALQERFERLDRRVMAAGVIADPDLHPDEILRTPAR
jgi:hypothetical protein